MIKKLRGKQVILVKEDYTAEQILKRGIETWSNFDLSFHPLEQYVLLYPDGLEVVLLRSSPQPFNLKERTTQAIQSNVPVHKRRL